MTWAASEDDAKVRRRVASLPSAQRIWRSRARPLSMTGLLEGPRPMRNAAPCGKISRDYYLDSQAYPAKLTMYLLPARHAERPRAGLFFVL